MTTRVAASFRIDERPTRSKGSREDRCLLEADRCVRGRQEPHPTSPDQPIVMDDSAQPTRPFQPRRIDGLRWFRSPVLRLGRPLAGQMLPGCLVESGSRRPDTHVPGCTPLTRSRWASSRQPTYG